jgi:PAS domain S-box-containing protein
MPGTTDVDVRVAGNELTGATPGTSPQGSGPTIGRRLLMMVAAVMLPLLLLSGLIIYQVFRGERARAEEQLSAMARGLAMLLDARFMQAESLLRGLASGNAIKRGDLDGFGLELAALPLTSRATFIIYDANGQIVWRRDPPDTPSAPRRLGQMSANAEQIARVARSGTAEVSAFFFSNVAQPGVTVNVPVEVDAGGSSDRLVLAIVLNADELVAMLRAYEIPERWYGAVIDPNLRLVARTRASPVLTGQPAPEALLAALASEAAGVVRHAESLEGEPVTFGYARLARNGYAVAIGVPEAEFQRPLRQALAQSLLLGVVLSGLGLWLALRSSRRLAGAVQGLSAYAGSGSPERRATGIPEVDEVADRLHQARQKTERAMAALRTSEAEVSERLNEIEALYRNAPIGLAMFDRQGRFLRVNATLATINGLPVEGHLGRRLFDVLPYLERELAGVLDAVFNEGRSFPRLEIHREPAGPGERHRWFIARYFPVDDDSGRVRAAGVIVEEITAQREAENALLVERERLRIVVENVPSIVWTADADGRTSYISPRWQDVTGRGDLDESNWSEVVHPDDVPVIAAMWEHCRTTSTDFEMEHRVLCADGSYRWFLSHARLQREGTVEGLRWFGSLTMIEDQKRTEARLQATLAERELLIREVDHRVKNSLSVVQSLLRLQMNSAAGTQVREQLREAAQRIHSIARVHDRLNIGRSVSHVEAVEFFAQLGRDLTDVLGLDALGRRLEVSAVPIMLTSVQAVSLGLAVTELVTNAVKYGAGTVEVAFRTAGDAELSLIICDEGEGPDATLSTAQSSKLGMQIVSAMARQLSGRFSITREDKVCFVLTMPREPDNIDA